MVDSHGNGRRFRVAVAWPLRSRWKAAALLKRVARHVLRQEGWRSADLSLAVVGARAMARLHRRYLGRPGPTDVLTFDLGTDRRRRRVEGEILVCADIALRRARQHIRLSTGVKPSRGLARSSRRRAAARAEARGSSLRARLLRAARAELALYVVHGVLHLSGHEDATPRAAARMHAREDQLLTQVGVGPVFRLYTRAPSRPLGRLTTSRTARSWTPGSPGR